MKIHLVFTIILSIFIFAGCSKDAVSDRDFKKLQQQSNADIKRKELARVASLYQGIFKSSTAINLAYSLKLEIRDVPTVVEGQVDPILVPILTGYLRFYFSSKEQNKDYVSFSVQKAEFDFSTSKLNLVLFNESYKEIYINCLLKEEFLLGTWTIPTMAVSGETRLEKREIEVPIPVASVLSKTYQGEIINTKTESNLPDRLQMSFVTSQDPVQPNNIKVTGSLRLYYGSFSSIEFQEFPFSEIQYNFFTKKLSAKTDGNYKLTVKADIELKQISGKIFSDSIGEMATFEVTKNE